VPERLLPQALLRLQHVTVRGPAVGRAARDLAVAEVSGGGAAMPRRQLELRGSVLVELRFRGEAVVQFQTLTSR
jgi:hypothetical protein